MKYFIASRKGKGHERIFLLFLSFPVFYNSVEVLNIFKWINQVTFFKKEVLFN